MISLGSNQTQQGQIRSVRRRKTGSTRCCLIYGWEINIKWNQNIMNVFICTRGLSAIWTWIIYANIEWNKVISIAQHPTAPRPPPPARPRQSASLTIREYPWRTHASGVARTLNMTTNGRFVYGRNLKPSLGSRSWETLSSNIRFFFIFSLFLFTFNYL